MYYILTLFFCVVLVFSDVVLLCYGVIKVSDEYGVRNWCTRVNPGADVGEQNYGAFILINRSENGNVKKI